MDRLAAMNAFVCVVDHHGFAPAARRLGVSPPAMTRLIASLEDALSIRLLRRTTRSLTLTDAGARYLEKARQILTDVAEAENAARAEQSEPSGRFVVAAPNVFGRLQVAPLLCEFLLRHSSVTAELTLSDRMVNLVEDGVDVAVRIGSLSDSALRVHPVGATRRVLVASPTYLKASKRIRHPRDLASHKLIQLSALAHGADWRFRDGSKEVRIAITPKLITNSADAAIGHAERDGGLTLALGYQVLDRVRSGALQIVLAKYEPAALPIQLVYSGSRHLSAAVRAFINLAVQTRRWSFLDM